MNILVSSLSLRWESWRDRQRMKPDVHLVQFLIVTTIVSSLSPLSPSHHHLYLLYHSIINSCFKSEKATLESCVLISENVKR